MDANEAAQQGLEAVGGEAGVFLRLVVARIAAGKARGEIGHDGYGGAAKAAAARQNDFRHGRHADEISPEDAGGADFRRRLEARPGEPHVDAVVKLDVGGAGRLVQLRYERAVVGLGQRHEALRARVADQRVGSGEVDMIPDRH